MRQERPLVFIGSSSEGLSVAEALQELLDPFYEVKVWTQGVFGLSYATLESLFDCSREADFAVLVLASDDLIVGRGKTIHTPRDNVVFELGLFMGALGRERTFFVYDRTSRPSMPTDLAGITAAEYAPPSSGDLLSALGAPASKIRRSIDRLGRRNKVRPLRTMSGCQISVRFGRIEDCATPQDYGVVVLPANEFFDDECVFDRRSALGAFVNMHFRNGPKAFQVAIRSKLAKYEGRSVEKEPGITERSYGVGTAVFLENSNESEFNVAAVAVTTKRSGEGLKATPAYIITAVASIAQLVADKRLSIVQLPLLGAGHGGVPPAVSLQCILIGLSELTRSPVGHHLKRCEIIVFQGEPESSPELSEQLVQQILGGGENWIGVIAGGL